MRGTTESFWVQLNYSSGRSVISDEKLSSKTDTFSAELLNALEMVASL